MNTCPNWRELCVPVSTEVLGCETNQLADLMFGEGQEKTFSGSDEYVTRQLGQVFIPIFLGVIHKTSYCIHQASILPFHLTIGKNLRTNL
jgi:hypothetical protein